MKRIILVTGGARSGKSTFAEALAMRLSPNPVYLATAQALDEEMADRVRRHQERRGPAWTTVEEPLFISRCDMTGRTVLVDCLKLFASNVFFAEGEDVDVSLARLKREVDAFTVPDAQYIFVTNEIGMGGIGATATTRRYTDLLGWLNQYVASRADEVWLLVSGIPLKIKSQE